MKKLSQILWIGLCGVLMSTAALAAAESGEREHTPIGSRAEALEMRIAKLEERAQKEAAAKAEESMKPQKLMKSIYYTAHPGAYQSLFEVYDFGTSIELADGSIWAVRPSDAYIASTWLWQYNPDLVVITPNHTCCSAYPFRLTNQATGDSVAVDLDLGPILSDGLGNSYARWIVDIDYYWDYVYLDDGSIWNMSSFDSDIIFNWRRGDIVIIGVNDGLLSSFNPNILINVATLDYAAGSVKY